MNCCIMLLFDTGMRCNEMILMEPEDIKPEEDICAACTNNAHR